MCLLGSHTTRHVSFVAADKPLDLEDPANIVR